MTESSSRRSDRRKMRISGRFLVRHHQHGDHQQQRDEEGPTAATATISATPRSDELLFPVLVSDVGLSFWGGIDPLTGIVVDVSHPLAGECVSNKILCLPSGRGSCTASQVLLELLLSNKGIAPAAIVLRDADGLVCVGAIVAQEIFDHAGLDILCMGQQAYDQLLTLNNINNNNTTMCSKSNTNNQQEQQEQQEQQQLMGRVLSNGQLEIVQQQQQQLQQQQNEEDHVTKAPTSLISTESEITFSQQETEMLNNCTTQAERMALRVIFRYARVNNNNNNNINSSNPTYLPIAQAHIDGCTYIGPAGLDFCRRLVASGGQVRVPTTLNSGSTDRRYWKQLGVPHHYANNAVALGDAYLQLGCQPSFTCAPYLLEAPLDLLALNNNRKAIDVAWGESNAVVYANSVLGARTEKYADYLDICCAIAGIVPAAGVHLEPNRRPTVVLDATNVLAQMKQQQQQLDLDLDLLFPVLEHLCGSL